MYNDSIANGSLICIRISDLFNDALNKAEYIESNGRMDRSGRSVEF